VRHGTIDQHASLSRYFKIDARVKIVTILIFVVTVSLLREIYSLSTAFLFITILILLSRIPLKHFIKRYSIALPFIFFASISLFLTNNIQAGFHMFLRISTCVLALLLLSSTTAFFDLLKGLQKLKIPNIIIVLLMFTYRYFFVFIEEKERMNLARKSRGFTNKTHIFDKKTMQVISYTIGMILIRAYERGLRIYDALKVRGYEGTIKTLTKMQITSKDYLFCFIFLCFSTVLVYIEWILII